MDIVSVHKYVKSSPGENNNKFWEVTYYSNDTWVVRNGRVGSEGQIHGEKHGRSAMLTKINSKLRDGYKEVKTLEDIEQIADPRDKIMLERAALEQIAGNSDVIKNLITYFIEQNAHEIHVASGGKMNVDLSTGLVKTPMGILDSTNIATGRSLLSAIEQELSKPNGIESDNYKNLIGQYCMAIPSKVGSRIGWHKNFINCLDDVNKQRDFLDQMEATIDMAKDRIAQAKLMREQEANGEPVEIPRIFGATLSECDNPDTLAMIKKMYEKSSKNNHASSTLKVAKVYEVRFDAQREEYLKKRDNIGNEMLLWHGTRTYNILSILRKGLIIPPASAFNVCGRAFGNGVYFSDQSTKSLNYSAGYWDSNRVNQRRTFMFLADVAMGKMYEPGYYDDRMPQKGFDSTFAKGGVASVANNEMIVFDLDQINLRYLVEFH